MLQTSIERCPNVPFAKQTLLTLLESDTTVSVTQTLKPTRAKVDAYISLERNFQGQLYMLQDLKSSRHCTVPTSSIPSIHNAVSSSDPAPFLHIPSSTNYASENNKIIVINNDQGVPQFPTSTSKNVRRPIETITSMMKQIFIAGLSDYFEYDNKKRSTSAKHKSTSPTRSREHITKKRKRGKLTSRQAKQSSISSNSRNIKHTKEVLHSNREGCTQRPVQVNPNALPVVTMGWSTQDCSQYGSNLASVAGNVKPFLRDGNLPKQVKLGIVGIVEFVLQWFPKDWAFNIEKCCDSEVISLRSEMIADFKECLSGDRKIDHFRVEGITILIPLSIGMHKDTLNCFVDGMRSVISINCQIPLNEQTVPDGKGSRLWQWLNGNGYTESFPCSMILYSRKQVYFFCKKMSLTKELSKKDMVRKCMTWALFDRVRTVTDYRSRVWNNDSFPNLFKKHSKKFKTSRFKGSLWASPACYDKTVSTI